MVMSKDGPLSLKTTVKLWDGCEMPLFGLGTFTLTNTEKIKRAISAAMKIGYRHFDTAEFYNNEKDLADAILSCGVPREEIWVTSKIWDNHHEYKSCIKHVESVLEKTQLKYMDLYLIHAPHAGKNIEAFKALTSMKERGLIRSVGVSNFGVHHLEGLKNAGLPKPSVNQIELHPWRQFNDIVDYCRKEGIAVEGYTPLAKGERLEDATLVEIAKQHNKAASQILIRWSLQQGFITIPMSSNPDHILENSQVFDFELSEEDFAKLNAFEDRGCRWNPTTSKWID